MPYLASLLLPIVLVVVTSDNFSCHAFVPESSFPRSHLILGLGAVGNDWRPLSFPPRPLFPSTADETTIISENSVLPVSTSTTLSRRSFFSVGSSMGLGLLFVSTAAPALAETATTTTTDNIIDEAAAKQAAKERMAQRIADSKLKYRKPTDLVQDRKDNTDYSCVASTGSPCPEGLVPTAVQRELLKAFQKVE